MASKASKAPASALWNEVWVHQASSLPLVAIMALALILQNFVVPFRAARLLDETVGPGECANVPGREECPAQTAWWLRPELLRLFAIQILALALRSTERWLGERRVARVRADLSKRCFAAVLGQDDAFLDSRRVGELLASVSDPGVAYLCCDAVPQLARAAVGLAGGAVAMARTDAALAAVAMSTAPVLFVIQKLRSKLARRAARRAMDAQAAAQVLAAEALHLRATVRAHAAERLEAEAHARQLDGAVRHGDDALLRDIWLGAGAESMVSLGELALLCVAGRRRAAGALSLGTYAAFRAALVQYQRGLLDATKLANKVSASLGKAERYIELVHRVPAIRLDAGGVAPSTSAAPRVELIDVSFAYDAARMDTLALRGVSVCLEPATTTALVGTSGSGKSTIASLVLRLFDPTAGGIFIDGDRLDALDVVRHRRRIGVVQQEPCLFDRTVFENIAYGLDPPPSRQRVIDAAIASNLDDVVKRLANGYDERLGEHSRLSGGEKQRVAIARALAQRRAPTTAAALDGGCSPRLAPAVRGPLQRAFQVRDPNLLLLDEATSALDAQSEAVVIEALDAAARGRTTLTVAHRLATIRRADSIVVMDKGLIVDQGTHSALMRRDGLYKRLVDQQVGSPPQPKQPKKAPRAKTVFRNADDDTDTDTSLRRSFGDTAYD